MILPVSAQRFCCRNRVTEGRGHWGDKSAREKYKPSDGTANFGLLRDPSFLAPSMQISLYVAVFERFFNFHQIDSQNKPIGNSANDGTQKGGVPEEAKIFCTSTIFVFFTCALGAPMSDSLPYAVSAAEPLCTHGKDHPGLGRAP